MKKIPAALLLLVTTFFWGVTFTIVKQAIDHVDVFVFLSQRFLIATIVMLPWIMTRKESFNVAALTSGCILGVLLFAAYAFQTVGLKYTSASNAAFLTGLNVVLVPVFGAFLFRQPVGRSIRWGVGLAVVGLFLLCGNGSLGFNKGDLFATLCGGSVALHLIFTGRYAQRAGSDVYLLTILQLGTVGALSCATAAATGQSVMVWHPELAGTLVVCVLIATVFAFLVQTSMQRHLSPSHTALIFCMEPVFGAVYAHFALGERLGMPGYLGAALILAGMILSEMLPDEVEKKESISLAAGADL